MASESHARRVTSIEERETGCARLRKLTDWDGPFLRRTGMAFLRVLDSVQSMRYVQEG